MKLAPTQAGDSAYCLVGNGLAPVTPPTTRHSRGALKTETGAGTAWRCRQSNRNSSPNGGAVALGAWPQAMRLCHSASAAEWRSF